MNEVAVAESPKLTTKAYVVRGAAIVGGIGVLALALPAIYFAFLSSLGLLGIAIVAGIGLAGFKAAPLFFQKWENRVLGARIREAQANPIEQIQNNIIRKAEQLQNFKQGLENIFTQIVGLKDSLKAQAKKDPTEDFTDQWAAVEKMEQFYAHRKERYSVAVKALDDYRINFERYKFKFGFGNAAGAVAAAMNAEDATTLVENMLADESFKAIDQRYNAAFAALDMDSAELTSAKQLSFGSGQVIDVQAIRIPTPQLTDKVAVKR